MTLIVDVGCGRPLLAQSCPVMHSQFNDDRHSIYIRIVRSYNLLPAKSLYRSRAGSHFDGTEYEIWADFGPVGNTEKKNWADYEQLLRPVF